jgi:hypothetical protein
VWQFGRLAVLKMGKGIGLLCVMNYDMMANDTNAEMTKVEDGGCLLE